jgi:hypothetical protein
LFRTRVDSEKYFAKNWTEASRKKQFQIRDNLKNKQNGVGRLQEECFNETFASARENGIEGEKHEI